MNPLFIPLKAEHYDDFEAGAKDRELRKYGARWNQKTCPVGREVILSRGYGRRERMRGIISGFEQACATLLPEPHRSKFASCYPDYEGWAAVIFISELRPV
jgi:hypothetical protein